MEGHGTRHRTICAQLSSMPGHEVRSPEKGRIIAAYSIPTRKWEQITTDLVTDLPPSDGYTVLLQYLSIVSQNGSFLPMYQGDHSRLIRSAFHGQHFRLHGTPSVIISDRNPRFTSHFWKQFFQILGMDL